MADTGIRYSIVVSTRNRPRQLAECLESIAAVDYPRDLFEVVVVDDGGALPLNQLVAKHCACIRATVLRQPKLGAGPGRTLGVRNASGEYVVFTDDDCTVTPDILRFFDEQFRIEPSAMVGGHTVNRLDTNPFAVASQAMIDMVYDYYNSGSHPNATLASNNMAVRRDLFMEVGGFNPAMPICASEDRELCDTWLAHGFPIRYVNRTVVHHAHQLSFASFLQQHFRYGRGGCAFHARRRSKLPLRLGIHWGFYTAGRWFWYPLSQGKGYQKPIVLIAVWLGHFAEFCGFVGEAGRNWRLRRSADCNP